MERLCSLWFGSNFLWRNWFVLSKLSQVDDEISPKHWDSTQTCVQYILYFSNCSHHFFIETKPNDKNLFNSRLFFNFVTFSAVSFSAVQPCLFLVSRPKYDHRAVFCSLTTQHVQLYLHPLLVNDPSKSPSLQLTTISILLLSNRQAPSIMGCIFRTCQRGFMVPH